MKPPHLSHKNLAQFRQSRAFFKRVIYIVYITITYFFVYERQKDVQACQLIVKKIDEWTNFAQKDKLEALYNSTTCVERSETNVFYVKK